MPVMDHLKRGGDTVALHRYGARGPQVLILPALGVAAAYYRPFAQELTDQGMQVAVLDWRGHGDSTPAVSRASDHGYLDLVGDVDAAVAHLGGEVTVIGHSLGGQIGLLAAATGASGIARIVLVAVGLPYFRDYSGLFRVILLPYSQAIGAVSALLGVWPGWTFGGRQAATLMRDWAATARTARFPLLNGADPNPAVGQLRLPVLAVVVDNDGFTPRATMARLIDRMPNAHVQWLDYTDELAGGHVDHIKWVRNSGVLAARIAQFVGP